MLEQELIWERDVFLLLNGSDSLFWDRFFYGCSYKWTWALLYLALLFVLIYRRPWKEVLLVVISVVVLIVLCDQLASGICKPLFHRFRPTHHPDFKDIVDIVGNKRGGLYGFVSSHAANAFGLATFTALLFRNRLFTATILMFAFLNAYSRIYLGVHFISDVIAGALLGSLCGYAVFVADKALRTRIVAEKDKKSSPKSYDKQQINLFCVIFITTILILTVKSFQS
ncbi:MAG: phosphatase PAP2 family protein [Candidatus Symbiothrix sp.]|nr:phosphatase PAP2 family protein [Candidatus Symbiothrix sp.]